MFKMGKSGRIALGILGSALLAGGCGGGGEGDSGSPEELLPGTWRVTRLQAAGQSTTCPGEIEYTENGSQRSASCGANDTATFFENGAITGASAGAGAYAGTWRLNDDTLTITITTPAELAGTEEEVIDFSDDDTFTATEGGTTATFTRQ